MDEAKDLFLSRPFSVATILWVNEQQLRVLRELGELGSVTAVAQALYITPSAVSQQLRALQTPIPVALTERDGRRLRLTAAGRALAEAAAGVETALAQARRAVEDFLEQPAATVSVAAFHSAAALFFPLLLRAVAPSGGPQLSLADEDVAQQEFPALTVRYDIVLAHRLDNAPSWPRELAVTQLLHEPLDVALPADHPLCGKRRLSPRDVAAEPWITVHDGFPLLATIEAIGAAAARPLQVAHRINDFSVALQAVAAGAGLALTPRWTVQPPAGVTLRPLAGVHARRHVDALCRPERTAQRAVGTVLQILHNSAGDIPALSRTTR